MRATETWVLDYLLNSLCQVPVVFAAAWAICRLMRRLGAEAAMEHRVWVGALLLEVAMPGCPVGPGDVWRWLGSWGGGAAIGEVRVTLGPGVASAGERLRLPEGVLAAVALAYAGSVLYFACRMAWGLWRTDAMRRLAEQVTLTGAAGRIWEECSWSFALGAVELAVSKQVGGPVTVGMWRGAMVVPPGFLERIGMDDLAAVIAHEFAHIRRRDFAKNVAYGLITLPLAYHPAVWLTRLRVAESREVLCDAMAAAAVAGTERYARSLLRLAALILQQGPARMSHAIGIFDANTFERRVMRLTEKRVEMKAAGRMMLVAGCVTIAATTGVSALALRMEVAVPGIQSASGSGDTNKRPARVSGGVMAGNVLTKVAPVYPPDAKAEKIEGAVVLRAIIGADGVVENLQVVSGPEKLRASSLDAVRRWTYKPYLLNGEPTEVETIITVTYSLSR